MAANAAIAKQAATARLLLASEALAQCRQETNPYLPGNTLFGPTRTQMFGPDPCLIQEKELAEASLAVRQLSAQPTPAELGVAPAPQLTSTLDPQTPTDPAIPITENVTPEPYQLQLWSPQSIENVMNQIWEEMEHQQYNYPEDEIYQALSVIHQQMVIFCQWVPDTPPKKNQNFLYNPKNREWIGTWVPK